jgi:thiamine biosynthesis lipoprotein
MKVAFIRLAGVFLLSVWSCTAAAQPQRFQFTQPKMGSPFNVIFYTSDSAKAATLAQQAFALVDSLNRIFSDYDPDSELSQLNRTAGTGLFVAVSAPLYDIMKQSRAAWQESRGTFDITMGPLSWLWRRSRREGRFPSDSSVQLARSHVGFKNIKWDTAGHRVQLFQPAMLLDLGGIAKGYVAQAVVDFLSRHGVEAALADAGGDIVCSSAPPGAVGWIVGINVPEQAEALLDKTVQLENRAVATSGDVYQFTEHNGRKYSHIIDPRTGYGITFQRNVTVIARDGATADWLATACSILPIRKAKKLARKQEAALLVGVLKNNQLRFYKTRNWKGHTRPVE